MKNLTLFVSSSDDYEDCWYPFFFLLKKFWPDCDLPIILNTETKSFSFEGLNILCTHTGKQNSFGETFHSGLDRVSTDNLILIMIDYFIMEPVSEDLLRAHYATFLEEHLDSLVLVEMKTITATAPLHDDILLVTGPGQDRFGFQIAIWKKDSLRKYVLKHENPWMAEWFGSLRYAFSKDRNAHVKCEVEPFKYLHTGALHKGGWIPETVPDLEAMGIHLDWSKRGFYKQRQFSLAERFKKRWKTRNAELRSRLHLFGLKIGLVKYR